VAYYGSGRGDYYRGDYYRAGGIFGSIGKFLGGVAKTVGQVASILPIPGGNIIGGVARAVGGVLAPNPRQGTAIAPFAPMQAPVLRQLPSLPPISTGQIGPFGQQTGGLIQVQSYTAGGRQVTKVVDSSTGRVVSMRKRMNVANPKALRRALRRVAGFGKLAKRAKRDIARAASAIGVRRGGGSSRGVITRSEAARALRR
jgi:hypothetical protein